jgi:predicted regulator of Ras-like GTPase activity (Roadblock/LC7/MglB family)
MGKGAEMPSLLIESNVPPATEAEALAALACQVFLDMESTKKG